MRRLADSERITSFMAALGGAARKPARVFIAGGATAVLQGWRDSTIDVDLRIVPDTDEAVFRAIPRLKEELEVNVELASPADFIPLPAGWEDRSPHIATHGRLAFHHFEFVSQALAKLERAHATDLSDVAEMLSRSLVNDVELRAALAEAEAQVHRFPAVDLPTWRANLEAALAASAN